MTTLTTEEVLEMARQAGFTSGEVAWHDNMFETFAKLVAEKSASVEREACAKLCEDASKPHDGEMHSDAQWAGLVLATTIRARGKT